MIKIEFISYNNELFEYIFTMFGNHIASENTYFLFRFHVLTRFSAFGIDLQNFFSSENFASRIFRDNATSDIAKFLSSGKQFFF